MVVCCLPEDLSSADLAVRVAGAVWVPTGSLGRGRLFGRWPVGFKEFCFDHTWVRRVGMCEMVIYASTRESA